MPSTQAEIGRRQCIPIIYTRGTHYEVGFDVGRNMSKVIKDFLASSGPLNNDYIPLYNTKEGRQAYEDTLASVKKNFPQYVREIEGTADGAQVPFYQLFLLHMDDITPMTVQNRSANLHPSGCSTICINEPGQEILGHTEDALSEVLNHFYFVSANIISDEPQGKWKVKEEKFTSLCYAGHLPGYTMNYNHHGLVFSINTLSAKQLKAGKTPRHFLTRALLSAENFKRAQEILLDEGCGAGDGCSINLTFLNQEGDRLFHNIEMGPAELNTNISQLNVLTASPGEKLYHCNKYLRLSLEENEGRITESSEVRMKTFNEYTIPKTKAEVINMLGDQSSNEFRIFQEFGPEDFVKTVAVGIFDLVNRTWSIYSDNPRRTEPLVVLPLVLKN